VKWRLFKSKAARIEFKQAYLMIFARSVSILNQEGFARFKTQSRSADAYINYSPQLNQNQWKDTATLC
jgi:hypothetical protein